MTIRSAQSCTLNQLKQTVANATVGRNYLYNN